MESVHDQYKTYILDQYLKSTEYTKYMATTLESAAIALRHVDTTDLPAEVPQLDHFAACISEIRNVQDQMVKQINELYHYIDALSESSKSNFDVPFDKQIVLRKGKLKKFMEDDQ